jgi:hypothetical protein
MTDSFSYSVNRRITPGRLHILIDPGMGMSACGKDTLAHLSERVPDEYAQAKLAENPDLLCPLCAALAKAPPEPVRRDDRTCFGIAWFSSDYQARVYAWHVERRGLTYNGGFMHGRRCGRDRTWDRTDPELGRLYAVTD